MTYSGTLMLVICAAVARLLYDTRDRGWAAVVMPALVASSHALVYAQRDGRRRPLASACCCCCATSAWSRSCRSWQPRRARDFARGTVTDRIYSTFDLNDPTSRDRVAMLQAGVGDRSRLSADRRRARHGPARLPRVPRRRRSAGEQHAPAQRADADRRRARTPGAGALVLVRRRALCWPASAARTRSRTACWRPRPSQPSSPC